MTLFDTSGTTVLGLGGGGRGGQLDSITSSALFDGVHSLTATARPIIAGNTSVASAGPRRSPIDTGARRRRARRT